MLFVIIVMAMVMLGAVVVILMMMISVMIIFNQTLLDFVGEFALMATLNIFAFLQKHILVYQVEEAS